MKRFSEGLTLLISTFVCSFSSLISIETSCANPQTPTVKPDIPKPSVPQFTLTYVQTFTANGTPHSANPNQPTTQPTTASSHSVPEFSPLPIVPLFVIKPLILSLLLRKKIYPLVFNRQSRGFI